MRMDGASGDLPTGSSGGGGKRGYGVRTSFVFTFTGAASTSNTAGPSNEASGNPIRPSHNRSAMRNEGNVVNWLAGHGSGVDSLRFNGHDGNRGSASSSSDQEFRFPNGYDDGRDRANNGEFSGQQVGFRYTAYFGYAGFIGFPNVQGVYGYAGFVSAPIYGQGGLALRQNGSNAVNYYGRPGVINGNAHGVQGEYAANNIGGQVHYGGFSGIYCARRDGYQNMNRISNGRIFYYATTTAYAYRRLNGEILSDMLSLRDCHVFNIMNCTDYAGPISQFCNNPDLAEAMINHLDCLKALLVRNLPLALMKQIACVNAVMKLLNEPYNMQEEWTFPVMSTVSYDLRIITDRAASTGCGGRAIIRYDWAINNVTCYFHPADCQCHQAKAHRTRKFYRR